MSLALALGTAAVAFVAAIWSPSAPAEQTREPVFVGSFDFAATSADMMTIRVTATGSMQNVVSGAEVSVQIPKGGTVAQLTNRLTDRYPVLQPYAMVALNGGMLPLSLPLEDGQTVELMAPHSAGLTFLGKPLPTIEP
jgi:hypothetical protein